MLWEEVDNSFDISFTVWFSSLGWGTTALILGLRPGQFLCVKPGGEIKKVRRKLKFHPTQLCLKTIILQKNFKKKGEKKLSLAKRQDRDQNCTKKGSGFMGFSIPFNKNYDPSLVYHLNQLQVLTQYFITVHWAISRLLTGFWPVNHTCWVSHTLSASLHAACWRNERRLSLQAELPATPWNSRPRSQS